MNGIRMVIGLDKATLKRLRHPRMWLIQDKIEEIAASDLAQCIKDYKVACISSFSYRPADKI